MTSISVSERRRVQQVPIFRSLFFSRLYEPRLLSTIQAFQGNSCHLWLAIREESFGSQLIDGRQIQELTVRITHEEFILYLVKEIITGRYQGGDPIFSQYVASYHPRQLVSYYHISESLASLSTALILQGHIEDGFQLAQKMPGNGTFQMMRALIQRQRSDLVEQFFGRGALELNAFQTSLFFSPNNSIPFETCVAMFKQYAPSVSVCSVLIKFLGCLVEKNQKNKVFEVIDDLKEFYEETFIKSTCAIVFLKAGFMKEASSLWKQVVDQPKLQEHKKYSYAWRMCIVQDALQMLMDGVHSFFHSNPDSLLVLGLVEDQTFFEVCEYLYFKKNHKNFILEMLQKINARGRLECFFRGAIEIYFAKGEPEKAVELRDQLKDHFSERDAGYFIKDMFLGYMLHGVLKQAKMMVGLPYQEIDIASEAPFIADHLAHGDLGKLLAAHYQLPERSADKRLDSLFQICGGVQILARSRMQASVHQPNSARCLIQ